MRGLALLGLLALLLPGTAARADAPAWGLVWQSETVLPRMTLAGRERTTMVLEGNRREATAEVRAAGGKLRLDFTAGARRWSMIDDGHNLIRLRPSDRSVMLLPRHPLAVDRGLAEHNYDARRTGTTTVAGRPAQAVEVTPRGGGRPVWRLWLDRQNSFALKRERYSVDGVMTTSSEFTSVDFHAQVDPSIFEIPAGYRQTGQGGEEKRMEVAALERQLGFSLHLPKYLPGGYTLLGGYVQREPGGLRAIRGPGADSAELRYTDGIRLLSIMQRPAAPRGAWREPRRGRSEVMDLSNRGSEKALRYNTPDRVIVVVGDLTQEELARVAKGME